MVDQDWIDGHPIMRNTLERDGLTVRIATWLCRGDGKLVGRRRSYITFIATVPADHPLEGPVAYSPREAPARFQHMAALLALHAGASTLEEVEHAIEELSTV